MRLLVLSFYYRPDLSAGSFRVTALVESLRTRMPPSSHIDVITTLPNRYQSFSADAPRHEESPMVSIERIALRTHKSGMVDQSIAFFSFAAQAMRLIADRDYDVVFATSSRLMTAVLGALIARWKAARLYLDIRDIFADTIKDVLRGPKGRVAERLASLLERFAITTAARVNVVSGGFLEYFQTRYPAQRFSCFSNGIDDEFLAAAPSSGASGKARNGKDALVVLYAGNVGEGQGLHTIVPPLAAALRDRVHFRIIGDGGRIEVLRRAIADAQVTNVEILPPVGRAQLIDAYKSADVLFLHLNDYPAFRKVLPSKIFEYAAMGKPLWAGVAGFSARFVMDEVSNAAIFAPCDVEGALRAFETLRIEDARRAGFLARYSRESISARLADDVLTLAPGRG